MSIKFSVLLPTRNRLEYLRYAVETVRRQDYADWEIVVSDNCSEDDIEAYVRLLDDPRVVYVRTQTFVPVTDNWNNALAHSTGDYVVMLGDDDGLMPNYFSKLLGAMERFPDPDFVYVSALFFAYPGVMPDAPDGFLREDSNRVFGKREPFWLDEATALSIVRGYLDLRMPVASNMQFSLISRRKVEQLSRAGGFFQSPYPDFYATPALFLTSSRILVYAEPMVIIGITPKSYGYFHFNNRAADGVKFLNNVDALADFATLKSVFLPGTSYNDSWLLAAQALSTNHGRERNLTPNYRRYRFLQIVHCYKRCYLDRSLTSADVAQLRRHMTVAETLMYAPAFRLGFGALGFIPGKLRARVLRSLRRMIGQHAIKESSDATPKFNDIVEAYESLDLRSTRPIAERAS